MTPPEGGEWKAIGRGKDWCITLGGVKMEEEDGEVVVRQVESGGQ